MKALAVFLLIATFAGHALACLGDTLDLAEERYGLPKSEKPPQCGAPLLEGAREATFEFQGWRIRCAFLTATDGKDYIVREEYRKIRNADIEKKGGSSTIRDMDREAVFIAEGGKWQRQPFGRVSAARLPARILSALRGTNSMWIREDSAVMDADPERLLLNLSQVWKYEADLATMKTQREREEAARLYSETGAVARRE